MIKGRDRGRTEGSRHLLFRGIRTRLGAKALVLGSSDLRERNPLWSLNSKSRGVVHRGKKIRRYIRC